MLKYSLPAFFGGILGLSVAIVALAQEPPPPSAPVKPSQFPIGSTPISATCNVAAATCTATLAAAAGKTTFICGMQITGSGATAASVVNATLAGVITGTLNYAFAAALGAAVSDQPLVVSYFPCLPGNAVNTAIVATLPTLGAGNTNAAISLQGYQL